MARKRTAVQLREMKCTICGQVMYVSKHMRHMTPKGHIKTMYCPICKQETDFIQTGVK